MIISTLHHAREKYEQDFFKQIFSFLSTLDAQTSLGRHIISTELGIFAELNAYTPQARNKLFYESHKKYIDLQYVFDGAEYIFSAPTEQLQIKEDLTPERDVIFYKKTSLYLSKTLLSPETFALFFPEDAHMPGVAIGKNQLVVRKAVVKIPVKLLA